VCGGAFQHHIACHWWKPVLETNHDSTQSGFPPEAEEEYCDWINERDRIENEREAESEFWHQQEQLQKETDK
jgi:hypothetical protein